MISFSQENPKRANGHIFNVGNPRNEATVRDLAELMTDVRVALPSPMLLPSQHCCACLMVQAQIRTNRLLSLLCVRPFQVYCRVSGQERPKTPTVDVTSKEFYGVGYDDSDKRIPDMTLVHTQLGTPKILTCFSLFHSCQVTSGFPLLVVVLHCQYCVGFSEWEMKRMVFDFTICRMGPSNFTGGVAGGYSDVPTPDILGGNQEGYVNRDCIFLNG